MYTFNGYPHSIQHIYTFFFFFLGGGGGGVILTGIYNKRISSTRKITLNMIIVVKSKVHLAKKRNASFIKNKLQCLLCLFFG